LATIVVTVVAMQSACAGVEKILNPVKKERAEISVKQYEKDGLSFSYPDNWSVTEDSSVDNDIRHINIEDADNTLFIVQVMSPEFDVDLEERSDSFICELPTELPLGKVENVTKGTATREFAQKSFEGVRRRYSIAMMGERIPHTIDFFLIDGTRTNALIMIQVPDEDSRAAEKEIRVIASSIKFE
jgi:hypothetical protein